AASTSRAGGSSLECSPGELGATRDRLDAGDGELGDVPRRLVDLLRRAVEGESQPLGDRIAADIDKRLRHDAADAAQGQLIGRLAAGHAGAEAGEVLDTRPNALLAGRVERPGRIVELALDQLVDRVVIRRQHPAQEHGDVAPQFLFRRLPDAGLAPRLGRRPHRVDGDLQYFAVQAELVAEMVVDRNNVRARRVADVADGDVAVAALGEQRLGRVQQPVAGLDVDGDAKPGAAGHSVRLNSSVAALIATAANSIRNVRSPAIATNPVFL